MAHWLPAQLDFQCYCRRNQRYRSLQKETESGGFTVNIPHLNVGCLLIPYRLLKTEVRFCIIISCTRVIARTHQTYAGIAQLLERILAKDEARS